MVMTAGVEPTLATLRGRVLFGFDNRTEVRAARWDDASSRWTLTCESGCSRIPGCKARPMC